MTWRLHEWLFTKLFRWAPMRREPDFTVMNTDGQLYLERWFIIPRNRFFNIYLHHFLKDDDDCALHDHPWPSMSLILKNGYEELVKVDRPDVDEELRHYFAGDWVLRKPTHAHRVVLRRAFIGGVLSDRLVDCWTLFITGPRIRRWGFHCPQGWIDWEKFTKRGSHGEVGKGCDQ